VRKWIFASEIIFFVNLVFLTTSLIFEQVGTFIDDFELTSNQSTLKSVDDHFIELIFDSKKPAIFFLVMLRTP
jgi:hypothetical protein